MQVVEVFCPGCGQLLTVSREYLGKKGRCRACKKVFVITETELLDTSVDLSQPGLADTSVEDILDWLGKNDQPVSVQQSASSQTAVAAGQSDTPRPPKQAKQTKPTSERKYYDIRLGHVDDMGAFFLFDPELLYDEDFRSAFPQKCVVCGKRRHLSVHLVVWASKLPGRGEIGARTSYSRSVLELNKLGGVSGRELLEVLDPIESLPEPYCLPFPYYLCRECSPIGAVVPDVRFTSDGRTHECELGIFSLKQAEEFIRIIGGPDCSALKDVCEAMKKVISNPWLALPLAIRSRIKQWFTSQDGEKFVIYIPDGDFSKTEAGLAGIVLTNKRLVFRKFASTVEIPLTEKISIEQVTAPKTGQIQLRISSQATKPALLVANEGIAERLRTFLRQVGAKADWITARK
ncbi:MAG: hypothetical protein K8R91_02965 [Phycisphaerae bacterium]|nr:hypothetical protein [Phycisphaerae bacterium]